MSFRFFRRVRLAPGITLNLSRSGGSLSFGPRGAKITVGSRGRRATLGLPGTGLFYTTTLGARKQTGAAAGGAGLPGYPEERLTLGFFRRLVTPPDEQALMDGCLALVRGDADQALGFLERASKRADGAYLAGFLALKAARLDVAERCLIAAAERCDRLGRDLQRYGIDATLDLAITDQVTAHVTPTLRGVLLGLVEVYQAQGHTHDALSTLERLRAVAPADEVVGLSLAELLLEAHPDDPDTARRVIHLAEGIENDSPINAARLLYRARALRVLKMADGAREILGIALRRRKDRPPELMHALRYERALAYTDLGQEKRARADLERLYAEAPKYADVARRLGLGEAED